jgi:DNA repair exonuclease SbcCD nuclease subunit
LVFTADSHITEYAWKRHQEVRGDSYRGFQQVVSYCVQNQEKVAALVQGGDLFDAHPSAEDVDFYLGCVLSLKLAGIPLYLIQGQHGRARTIPWGCVDHYATWLHGLKPQPLPFGRHISGIDNLPPDQLQEALKTLDPSTDILVLHQAARGSIVEIGGVQNWDFDPNWTPPFVKLVLLGDIHKIWEHTIERRPDQLDPNGSKTFLTYSGSTAMMSIDEEPRKSFIVVDLETLALRRESINTRCFIEMLADSEAGVEAAIDTIKKQAPETLIVVRYDSHLPVVETRCRAANKGALFIFRLLPLERVVDEPTLVEETEGEPISLKACLDKAINKGEQPALHALVGDLLTDRDHRKVLAEHKAKFLGVIPT